MSNKTEIQANNKDIQTLINKAKALPVHEDLSRVLEEQDNLISQIATELESRVLGGAKVDTVTVTLDQADGDIIKLNYTGLVNDKITWIEEANPELLSSISVVKDTMLDCQVGTSNCIDTDSDLPWVHILTDSYAPQEIIFLASCDGTIMVNPCFVYGTLITLYDGSTKPVQDITYTDKLLVWDFDNGCFAAASPIWIMKPQVSPYYYQCEFENGTVLKLVGSGGNCHAVYCVDYNRFEYANNCVGKLVMTENGASKLLSCEKKYEEVNFYNLMTDRHINCHANHVLTSSKLNNIYPMKDMKFVKEEREILPIEAFNNVSKELYDGLRLSERKLEDVEWINNNLAVKLNKTLPKG